MIQRFLLVSVYYFQLVLSGLQIADCNGCNSPLFHSSLPRYQRVFLRT